MRWQGGTDLSCTAVSDAVPSVSSSALTVFRLVTADWPPSLLGRPRPKEVGDLLWELSEVKREFDRGLGVTGVKETHRVGKSSH